jgi:hypothetical protein
VVALIPIAGWSEFFTNASRENPGTGNLGLGTTGFAKTKPAWWLVTGGWWNFEKRSQVGGWWLVTSGWWNLRKRSQIWDVRRRLGGASSSQRLYLRAFCGIICVESSLCATRVRVSRSWLVVALIAGSFMPFSD